MNCSRLALLLMITLLASASLRAQEVENPALSALAASTVVRLSGHEAISTPFMLRTQTGIVPEFRITRALARREITVQYQETDFAFIARLLEDEGKSAMKSSSRSITAIHVDPS